MKNERTDTGTGKVESNIPKSLSAVHTKEFAELRGEVIKLLASRGIEPTFPDVAKLLHTMETFSFHWFCQLDSVAVLTAQLERWGWESIHISSKEEK